MGSVSSPGVLRNKRWMHWRPNRCVEGCAGLETKLEETSTQLQMRQSLSWDCPAPHNQLKAGPSCASCPSAGPFCSSVGPSYPSCGRQLFPTSAESLAEGEPLPFSSAVESASPASFNIRQPTQPPPDMTLRDCLQNVQGEHRPVVIANAFMALTPFRAYTGWVNWSGSNGKYKLL